MADTIAFDFDGVIHTYKHWVDIDVIDGAPVEGISDLLYMLRRDGFEIKIYSCRAKEQRGIKAMKEWLNKYDLLDFITEITAEKPIAKVYVDDRAIRFDGYTGGTLYDDIVNFKSWTEEPKEGEIFDEPAGEEIMPVKAPEEPYPLPPWNEDEEAEEAEDDGYEPPEEDIEDFIKANIPTREEIIECLKYRHKNAKTIHYSGYFEEFDPDHCRVPGWMKHCHCEWVMTRRQCLKLGLVPLDVWMESYEQNKQEAKHNEAE